MKKISLLLVLMVSFGISAKAQFLVDIQFGGNSYGTTYSDLQTGAGLVGSNGDVWNNIAFQDSFNYGPLVASNLESSAGTASDVTLTITSQSGSQGEYSTGTGASSLPGTVLSNLYEGFLNSDAGAPYGYGGNTSSTFVFSGLTTGLTYNLYIYSAPNHDQTANWSLNGGTATTLGPNSGATTLTSPNNYIILAGTADMSGDLTLNATAISNGEIDVNGFQLQAQAVPEPSAYVLLAEGLILLFVIKRKRAHTA